MESYLNENFGGVKAKNSPEEALRRWREICSVVKNMDANLFGVTTKRRRMDVGPSSASFVPPSRNLQPDELANNQVFEENKPSVAFINNLVPQRFGSGFIWDIEGHIVTNYHVIRGPSDLSVILADETEYEAKVVGHDPDVAVLRIYVPKEKLRRIKVGRSSNLCIGQKVCAIGHPDTMVRRPADPEEELRWMSQEVRSYVEAVLNSLAANVPKAVVLCQVEKAKEDMLNQLYSSVSGQSNAKIAELLQEDQNVKRRRERIQKQSSLLSKLTRQLSIHDNRAAAASWSDASTATESSPRTKASGDDWRSAFDAAANGSVDSSHTDSSRSRSSSNRRHGTPTQNGDANSGANSGSRRTPNRLPPAPPQGTSTTYRY